MTVRKKGNKWYCRFQLDGVRYERRCPLAMDEKTAKQAEKIIQTEIMRGNLDFAKAKPAPKLKEALKIYLKYSEVNKLSYKSDLSIIKNIVSHFGENYLIQNMAPDNIEEFKLWLKVYVKKTKIKVPNPDYGKSGIRKQFIFIEKEETKTRSNATINRHVEVLSKMFNLCIGNNLLESNPCKDVGELREDNFKIRVLQDFEEKELYAVFEKEQELYKDLCNIVTTVLQTGMRKGEVLSLQWYQVDFKLGHIELLNTKSGKKRKIPINDKLDNLLKVIFATSKSSYVFPNPETGEPYTDIKRSFATVLKKANIKNFRFHDLRHTVTTRLIENGVPLPVVQEIMGHTRIETTMRYTHPNAEYKKVAVDILKNF